MNENHKSQDNVPPRNDGDSTCDPGAGCCGPVGRREFIKIAGLSAASLSAAKSGIAAVAGPFDVEDVSDHFVPADKKLNADWVKGLFDPGERTFYQGDDLRTIAMPVGGICAGQLYITGDGRLVHWDIFNRHVNTGFGKTSYYLDRRPEDVLRHGFAVEVKTDGRTQRRRLDAEGFPGVRFSGEYPIATVEYRDESLPVSVTLEAFSPFIPLDASDSALPATVMQFSLRNTSNSTAEVSVAGWLENGVCLHSAQTMYGMRRNRVLRREGLTMLLGSAREVKPPVAERPPIVLADFEGDDYGDWVAEGKAFGTKPARGTLPNQQQVGGFRGQGLISTYLDRDPPHGKLTSPPFKIERSFICFLISGGNHAAKTCVNLLVDGRVVRMAVGRRSERLEWATWAVKDLAGKEARIEIVDAESGPWGHVNVDQIELRDTPATAPAGSLSEQPDFGTMGLTLLDDGLDATAIASLPDVSAGDPLFEALFNSDGQLDAEQEKPLDQRLTGALCKRVKLKPGEEARVTFLVSWCFGNRPEHGNFYATRFADAAAVAEHVASTFDRLASATRLWHATWYDSTLPHWLLDRLFSTTSTLATSTCQWWADGRFWAYEGVGCCRGTCTHVWNYEHTMARLFPQLERSVREMQDFNPAAGFEEGTGMVRFRGENWDRWAGDGQAGTVLKAYREHQVSADDRFLRNNWPRIRRALEFLIREDGNNDGLLEGPQHNTYDIDFHGPNTMVGSLYLAALRAAEEMAREVDDTLFADRIKEIFEKGKRLSVERLFNGEYFVQKVDLEEHPKHQYADGCLADQLFGQGWAHQVGLGYVYPEENVRSTLQAIWRYNWAPDIGPQNEVHLPERWFASPGEAGLFTCTWPKSPHLAEGVRYKNEVWTGIEYQVAGNMAFDGMVTEALAVCRGIHERYHPLKHNPFNEVECGDHYARGMASYGVFLALSGFEYHGPKNHLGFSPRITPDQFRAAFTAAEGWGTISQTRDPGKQTDCVEVKHGELAVATMAFELPDGAELSEVAATLAGRPVSANGKQQGRRVTVTLPVRIVVGENETLEVTMST